MDGDSNSEKILTLTVEIVSSHVANNRVEMVELPTLIEEVYAALSGLGAPTGTRERRNRRPEATIPGRPRNRSINCGVAERRCSG